MVCKTTQTFFVLLCTGIAVTSANITLQNSAPTNWGFWGNWEYCPQGSYAGGMQLKVQKKTWWNSGDDTGLNAIKLLCVTSFMENEGYNAKIMSKEGAFGEWGKEYRCDKGYLTGFQLRSEPDQGSGYDSTAANNLRVFCSNPAVGMIEGDGTDWGSWGLEEKCLKEQAICGLKTQVSWNLYSNFDNVGLNNVYMQCCDLPDPLALCEPKDDWEKVGECDNIINPTPLPCTVEKAQGLNYIGGDSKDGLAFGETLKSLGYTLEKAAGILPQKFAQKLKVSSKTSHDWTAEPTDTWVEEKKKATPFLAQPGKLVRVFQVVGNCGPYNVRTAQFKMEETDNPF